MRAVVQRVKQCQVSVDNQLVGSIGSGLLVLLGVAKTDTFASAESLVSKILTLRIFDDDAGKMNLSVSDINGQILVVSQFTIYGNCAKGRRPSFDDAADPVLAEDLYKKAVALFVDSDLKVETGRFRAMMDVSLINDGPVTLIVERNL